MSKHDSGSLSKQLEGKLSALRQTLEPQGMSELAHREMFL